MDSPCPHLLAQLEELPKHQRRAEVLSLMAQRELKVEHAASILSLSVRQIQRLKKRRKTGGECWDVHGNLRSFHHNHLHLWRWLLRSRLHQ